MTTSSKVILIKDSIACNGKTISSYKAPYFKLESEKSSEVLNELVKQELEPFFKDDSYVYNTTSLKNNLQNFTTYIRNKCCATSCYSFHNSDYNVSFLNDTIISFSLYIETYTAYLSENKFMYNYNILNGTPLTAKDVFNERIQELVALIEDNVKNEYGEEYIIDDLPNEWYLSKNEQNTLGIIFTNGYPSDFNRNPEAADSYFEVFLAISKIEPYLTKAFMVQINMKDTSEDY